MQTFGAHEEPKAPNSVPVPAGQALFRQVSPAVGQSVSCEQGTLSPFTSVEHPPRMETQFPSKMSTVSVQSPPEPSQSALPLGQWNPAFSENELHTSMVPMAEPAQQP